jgi:single-strand DNA-binding protein
MNSIHLSGRIGGDAEIRTLQSGKPVASFSVATSTSWKDKDNGEWQEKTEWHKIVCYQEGLVGVIEKHAVKGRLVTLHGKLTYRTYHKEGEATDRTVAEIILDRNSEIEFPTPKPGE